jgi:predicted CXXCH cytochrome family protein
MNKIICIVGLAVSAAVLASCSLQDIIVRQQTVVVKRMYKDPHTDCAHCHVVPQPKGAEALFPPYVDPSKLCLDCHTYAANHHPVNVVPVTPVKPVFPLYNGEITCLTCHEIHGGPQHQLTPRLLRGEASDDRREICFDCHTREQYADLDPHIMKDDSGNRRVVNGKPVCLSCHELEPDPSLAKANTVLFKADIAFLCWRCHPSMKHGEFFEKHFLVTPSNEMRVYMNRPEVQDKYTLPLVPRGRITCSTCHNPHQEGIISFDPAAAGADSLHRLRDGYICAGCHKMLSTVP